jgi:hypothetical protein
LDKNLDWKAHLENRMRKACIAYWQCRRAVGKTWGLYHIPYALMLRYFNPKYMLLACSEYCISEGIVNSAVSICSDSRAALLALKSYAVSFRVGPQCRDSLQELTLSNRVRLVWAIVCWSVENMAEKTQSKLDEVLTEAA